jgi:DNA topoisomerase-1
MLESFPDIVDYKFTANMEKDLDSVEEGKKEVNDILADFWEDFEKELTAADSKVKEGGLEIPAETTDIICDKCGAVMIVKNGRFGKFAACPNYPQCKNTKPLVSPEKKEESENGAEKKAPVTADFKCEKCGSDMVQRTGRYGTFFACSQYPKCDFTKQKTKDIGVPCPKCGSKVVMKNGRNKTVFYSCEKYPTCDFSSWDLPTAETCPSCGQMLFRKKGKPLLICHNKVCGYSCETEMAAEPDGQE